MSTLSTTNIKHPSSASNNVVLDSSGNVAVQAGSASTPAIQATGDSNTGIYFSAADTVDIATGGTQRAQLDSSGNLKFNSGYGSVATAYGCRAWVNFDGTSGSIGSGRANGNVSSITDNGTGNYTVNFTTAMPDANYATQVTSADVGTGGSWTGGMKSAQVSAATGSVRVSGFHGTDSGEARDTSYVCVAIFR